MNKLIENVQYIYFDQIESTHLYARNYAHLYDGSYAFVANYQSNGIGKGQHVWLSPKGNLYVSFLLPLLNDATFISLLTACAIHQTISTLCAKKNVKLHWPNDIYVDNKKVCGILLEVVDKNKLIISFGINTTTIPVELLNMAEKVEGIRNEDLLSEIIEKINEHYNVFCIDKSEVIKYWNKNVLGLHEQIVIKYRDTCVKGLFNKIDCGGRIVVTCCNGEEKVISTGDMFVI